jgi:hypothetical protein
VGVALILLWWAPFWALGPWIADRLNGTGTSPTAATVTTVIVIVQTIIGLIGLWAAGTEIKSIVKHSSKKQALGVAWAVLIHGKLPPQEHEGGRADERPSPESQDIDTGKAPTGDG